MEQSSPRPSRLETLIGALELESRGIMIGNGALESACGAAAPTANIFACRGPMHGDGALEAAGGSWNAATIPPTIICPGPAPVTIRGYTCIGDGAPDGGG